MSEEKKYFGFLGLLAFFAFLAFLTFTAWQMRQAPVITTADVQKAREIAGRLS